MLSSKLEVTTVEPRFTDTRVIRKPCYYGQFSIYPWGKKTLAFIFLKFNPFNTDTGLWGQWLLFLVRTTDSRRKLTSLIRTDA